FQLELVQPKPFDRPAPRLDSGSDALNELIVLLGPVAVKLDLLEVGQCFQRVGKGSQCAPIQLAVLQQQRVKIRRVLRKRFEDPLGAGTANNRVAQIE
ncbi:unnamed protein product, partial [Tilletia controversa]